MCIDLQILGFWPEFQCVGLIWCDGVVYERFLYMLMAFGLVKFGCLGGVSWFEDWVLLQFQRS